MKCHVAGLGVLLIGLAGVALPVQGEGGRYTPRTERGQAAGQIVRKWSGYVHRVYGLSPQRWSASMRDTFAEADLGNMKKAAGRKTYEAMMGTLLGQGTTDSKVISTMAKSDGSVGAIMSLGSPANDLVYTMVAPCRIMDTRVAAGRLSGGVARSIAVHGANFTAQGGSAADCGIPADPSAVAINVVAVTPDQGGFMTIYPSGTTRPAASNINYVGGGIVANEIIAKTTLGQPTDLSVFSQYGTDVVIDIVGYFMAPEATALQCVTVTAPTRTLPVDFNGFNYADVACPTGYAQVSPYCWAASAQGVYSGGSGVNPTAFCEWKNLSGATRNVVEGARCCRIPGR